MYPRYIKRLLDLCISAVVVLILSPLFLILTVLGAIVMRGNPFFVQKRPGKKGKDGKEKIFSLIKFRTMTNERDADGKLLPDEERMTKYGAFLRASSLDEIPEFFNILKGDMSLVGPRPLLVEYLPRYSKEQRRRHDVLPGLTGYAQVHGRNSVPWEERFLLDIYYVDRISFRMDLKVIADTVKVVIFRRGISSDTNVTMEHFEGNKQMEKIGK